MPPAPKEEFDEGEPLYPGLHGHSAACLSDVRQAAAWLCEAFGFTVRIFIGNHRVQLNIGDGAMVVMEPKTPGP